MTGVRSADLVHREIIHTFAGGDLDRAAHLRTDGQRMRDLHEAAGARYLPFRGLDPLVAEDPGPSLVWLPHTAVAALVQVEAEALFLGLSDGAARFAVAMPESVREADLSQDRVSFRDVRQIAPLLTVPEASLIALGRSLVAWHAAHAYCPHCGSRASLADAGHARRCADPGCGVTQFPRTDPVVIMLVHREGNCLLGRAIRSRRYPPGLHSCLAGYVEPGESIEEAVRRETWEEAGLRVGRVRYHSSQPWPFPSTLMIGCFAEALPGEVRIDRSELESVRWFTDEELRQAVERWDEDETLRVPPPLTIAHQLARAWLAERPDLN